MKKANGASHTACSRGCDHGIHVDNHFDQREVVVEKKGMEGKQTRKNDS
jgi:hypothetical protein